jgi:hypothetical protein
LALWLALNEKIIDSADAWLANDISHFYFRHLRDSLPLTTHAEGKIQNGRD